MQKVFDFRPFDSSKSDFDCGAGEVQMPTNLMVRADGTYGPAPDVMVEAAIPRGYTALAVHTTSQGRRVIALRESVLCWASLTDAEDGGAEGARYCVGEFSDIGNVEAPAAVEMLADKVVIATAEGLSMLVWRSDGYDFINAHGGFPVMEFGLQKVGALVSTDVFDADGLSLAESGVPGSGASAVHPTAEAQLTQHTALFKEIAQSYTRAVEAQISAKGYFHQPFFVRYALRLSDGTHVLPSAPVLMLPTVLPPCIAINVASSMVSVDLSRVNLFELRYRMSRVHGAGLASLACAVDVFVSQPISTFDQESISNGYLTSYTQQLESSNAVNHDRSPSRGDSDSDTIFEGHYSTGGDNYTDHYLDSALADTTVLALRSNTAFNQQICSASDFHLIASIPLVGSDVEGSGVWASSSAFEPVPVDNTDSRTLASLPKLIDNPLTHCSLSMSAMAALHGRLMAAVAAVSLPIPFPIRSMGAAWAPDAEHGESALPVRVTVYSKIANSVRCVSSVSTGWAADVSTRFPRFVFYPDRHAFMMVVSVATINYMLPLTPHPTLEGAYWCGGYEVEYVPEGVGESALPQVCDSEPPSLRCCRLMVSEAANPIVFPNSGYFDIADADVRVMALAEAMKAPKQGSFGKYNFYAFSSRGLWMLECEEASVRSGQLISRHPCAGASSVAWTESGVAWSGSDGVFVVSGSDVIGASAYLPAMALDVSCLPCSSSLLDVAKMDSVVEDFDCIVSQCSLVSLPSAGSRVMAFVPGKDYALVYDMEHKQWSVFSAGFSGKIKQCGGNEWLIVGSDMVNLHENAEPVDALLITRPFALSAAFGASQLSSVEILGYFRHRSIGVAVYGSEDMHQWRLLSSSRGSVAEVFDRSAFRHYRIAIAGTLMPNDTLFGAKITC